MASSSRCTCITDLLGRICKLRRKELTIDTDSFTVVLPNDKHAWAKIFVEYFLANAHCSSTQCSISADDMLWYVQQCAYNYSHVLSGKPSVLEVFRRHSKKQPTPGCKSISWEETVYLNLILHHIEYTLTCAVCTKTSPHNLQILKKCTQRIFASPSRRRMDSKGEAEEIAYPHIYFSVDSFEQVFTDIVVRDGECVCVELLARDRSGRYESAVFLGSIRYEVLRQVYETKGSSAWQWAQKLVATTAQHLEFVRMRGPHGKGYAEMAVCKLASSAGGNETPTDVDVNFDDYEAVEAAEQYRRRRMSDTNLAGRAHSSYRWKSSPVKKSQSEADSVNHYPEVEASSIDEELEETSFTRLWNVRGFGQAWHWLREKRRATSIPLNAFLTYVTLPWTSIVEDLLDHPNRPVLNFDVTNSAS